MTTATIGSLSLNMIARMTSWANGMSRAKKSVRSLDSSVKAGARRFMQYGTALAGLALGGGMLFAIKNQMQMIDATAKLSDTIGIATEDLIGLRHAADLMGAGSDALDKALEQLTRRIGEAVNGMGTAKIAFDSMGLSADALAAMTPADSFREIAESIAQLETQSERVNAAYQIFGRTGIKLVNTLALGRDGLDAMQEEAERLGITFSRLDAARVEQANDAIDRMKKSFAAVVQEMAINLAPMIELLATRMTAFMTESTGGAEKLANKFNAIMKPIAVIVNLFDALIIGIKTIGTLIINAMIRPIENLFTQLGKLRGFGEFFGISPKVFDQLASEAKILDDTLAELNSNMHDSWLKESMGDQLLLDIEKIKGALDPANFPKGPSFDPISEGAVALIEDIIKLETSLQNQIDTFGMSASAAQIYALQIKGATDEQVALARALAEQIDLLNEQDALMREGQRIFEQTRTPIERFNAEMENLQKLLEAGAIDWETYERAVRQAKDQIAEDVVVPEVEQKKMTGEFRQVVVNRLALDGVQAKTVRQATEEMQAKANELVRRLLERLEDPISLRWDA